MAPPADGSPSLVQASAPGGRTQRVDLKTGGRRVVDVLPGDAILLNADAAGLDVVKASDDVVLVRTPEGAEILFQGLAAAQTSADTSFAFIDGDKLSLDAFLLLAEIAAVVPAAGSEREPGLPGSGGFGDLSIESFVGLSDLGPIGFSDPTRFVPEPEVRSFGENAEDGGGGGGDAAGGGGPGVPTISPSIIPASTLEDSVSPGSPIAVVVTVNPAAPGEIASVVVSGIQAGLVFNVAGDTTGLPAGSVRFTQAEALALQIVGVPANSDVDIPLTFTPFSHPVGGPDVSGAAQNWKLTIDAVADAPTLATAAATGAEDSVIALAVSSALADLDGSESLAVTISGVPSGATLSAGVETAPGSGIFVLTAAELAGLAITPPPGFNGAISLGVTATSTETPTDIETDLANNVVTTTGTLVVTVTPVSGVPAIDPQVIPADTLEDAPTAGSPVSAAVSLVPGGPGETVFVVVSGIPAGVTFNAAGTPTGVPGEIRFSQAEAATLAITGIPANSDAEIVLTFTPFSQDGAAPPVSGAPQVWTLTVDAVADAPTLATAPAAGVEDGVIALAVSSALVDLDGSESLAVTISGVPSGATLSAGVETAPGSGVYVLSSAELAGLTLTPPPGFSGTLTLGIAATSTETPTDLETDLANNVAATTGSLVVTVAPLSGVPGLIAPASAAGGEDLPGGPIAVPLVVTPGAAGETAWIVVSGIPAGVTFNAAGDATGLPPGSLKFTAAEAAALAVAGLPANSDSDFVLTVTPFSQDGAAPPTVGASANVTVIVDAIADAPLLATAPASGAEDGAIALSIASSLTDADGSEALAIRISGVPLDAALSAGTDLGGGAWRLTSAELAGLTLTPPPGFSGTLTLGITATSTETPTDLENDLADNVAATTGSLVVTVAPLSDVPGLVAPASVTGDEDLGGGPIAVPLVVTPGAAGETAWVVVSGIPAGVAFNAAGDATGLPAGSLRFTAAEAAALAVVGLPADSDSDFVLTVTPFSQDGAAPPAAGATANVTVVVDAVADAPTLTVGVPVTVVEGDGFQIDFASTLVDIDGSETLAIALSGFPTGTLLTDGGAFNVVVGAPTDRIDFTGIDPANVKIVPPPDFNGSFDVTVAATATENPVDGEPDPADNAATTLGTIPVVVTPVSDVPGLTVPSSAAGFEDVAGGPIAVPIVVAPGAPGETAWVVVSGIPAGVAFNAAGDATGLPAGSLRFTQGQAATLAITGLPANRDGDFSLTVQPFSQDGAAPPAPGPAAAFKVTIDAVADAPALTVSPAATSEDQKVALSIATALTDTDGSESIVAVTISGVPTGAQLSAGTETAPGSGVFVLTQAQLAGLAFAPPPDFNGAITLGVTATSRETPTDGEITSANDLASTITSLVVSVAPVSDAPTMSLTPQASGFEDLSGGAAPIAIPIAVGAGAPGETATVVVSGIPAGVTFNAAGVPAGAGALRFTQAEAAALGIAGLPANSDVDFSLTVTPFSQDGAAAPAVGPAQTIAITIDAVADAPKLAATPTTGDEDNAIALSIDPSLVDTDGSESLSSIRITGVPAGATLNHGSFAGGTWTLTPSDLAGLAMTPPANFNGPITLGVTATSTEAPTDLETTNANNAASAAATFVVTVTPVSDTPTMALGKTAADMKEDLGAGDIAIVPPAKGAVSIPITVGPGAPGETAYVIVSGIPTGVRFNSTGSTTGLPAGSIKFTQAQAAALSINQLPAHSDRDFTLTVTPFSQDVGGVPPAAGAPAAIVVTVDAVADRPIVAAAASVGNEDTAIRLNISGALVDRDGSEKITMATLGNIPSGSVLTFVNPGGVTVTISPSNSNAGRDTYVLPEPLLNQLRLRPVHDFNGTITVTATMTSHEQANGSPAEVNNADNDATSSGSFKIVVLPVSDTPGMTLGVTAAAAKEDMGAGAIAVAPPAFGDVAIPVTVTPGAPAESAYVQLTGWAAGTTFNLGTLVSSGVWRVQQADSPNLKITGLPANSDVDFKLTVTPFSRDGTATPKAGAAGTITVTVDAVADVPTLAASASGAEDTVIALDLTTALRDTDGSEKLSGQLQLDSTFELVTVSGAATTTLAPSSSSGGVSTYNITETQLPLLRVKPPADFNGDTTLTAGLTAREAATGATEPNPSDNTASTTGTFVLTVTPVSDTPALSVPSVVAMKEDLGAASAGAGDPGTTGGTAVTPPDAGAVAMPILVSPGAPGETAFVQISGVPAGVIFNVAGTTVSPGVLQFTQAEAAALTVIALPSDSDADVALTVTPFSQDVGGVAVATGVAQTATLRLDAVADVPNLSVAAAVSVNEDAVVSGATQRVALPISASLQDTDGSEALTVRITGVPAGISLSAGSFDSATDVWTVPGAALSTLQLVAPKHFSGAFDLGVTAVATETATGAGEPNAADNVTTRFTTLPVTIVAVADTPQLTVPAGVKGNEDSFIALSVTAALTDTDGSEVLTIRLTGIPTGSTLVGGGATIVPISFGGGFDVYDLGAAQLAGLKVRPPLDSNVDFTVGVTATATETSNGSSASATGSIAVDVVGVADPGLMFSAGATPEDVADAAGGRVPLNIVAQITDSDVAAGRPASETVTAILISGVPLGMSLSRGILTGVGAGGTTWSLKRTSATTAEWDDVELVGAQTHRAGTLTLSSAIVTTENDGDVQQTSIPSFAITVSPVVDDFNPSGGGGGNEDTAIAIAIGSGLIDTDGSERMLGSVTISGVPAGVTMRSGAAALTETAPGSGTYVVTQAQLAGLTAQPPTDSNLDFALTATMTVSEFDASNNPVPGQSRTESFAVTVDVRGVADVPAAAAGDVAGDAGTRFDLALGGTLADTDGSERLYFIVSNVPAGAGLVLGTAGAGKLLFNLGGGKWMANEAAVGDVEVRFRSDFADAGTRSVTLGLTAVAEENDGNRASSTAGPFVVTVTTPSGGGGGGGGGGEPGDPGPAPTISLGPSVAGTEDNAAPLSFSLVGLPADASGNFVIRAGSLPPGARLISGASGGIFVDPSTGDWVVPNDPAVLATLQIVPPADFSGNLAPQVDALVTYADGRIGTASATPIVSIAPVADAAAISASGAGAEDTLIKLDLAVSPTDTDGSETVSALRVSGVSAGATLVDHLGNPLAQVVGVYTIVDPADVYVRPATDFSGNVNLTVSAVTTDVAAGFPTSTTTTSTVVSVAVAAVADADPVSGPATLLGVEDGAIQLAGAGNVTVTPVDTDGSERSSVVVQILTTPAGLTFKDVALSAGINNGDGTWTLTAAEFAAVQMHLPPNAAGDVGIRVATNAFELSNGDTATTSRDFTVRFDAAADAPTLSVADSAGDEDSPIALTIAAGLVDVDGSETLSLRLDNLPTGATLNHGTDLGGGSWSLSPADLAGLTFTGPADDFGSFTLGVTATATEAGGGTPPTASTSGTLVVDVVDVVDTFSGGAGDDALTGTKGADVLEGKAGADALTGGQGADKFVYAADALGAADVIADLGAGDRLDVSSLLTSLATAVGDPTPAGDDYFKFVQNGADVEVRVDQNGAAAGDTATLLAIVQNQTAETVKAQTDFS